MLCMSVYLSAHACHEFSFLRKGKEKMENKYYLQEIEEVYKEFNTSKDGLSSKEAEARLEKYGKNKLKEAEKTPLWML